MGPEAPPTQPGMTPYAGGIVKMLSAKQQDAERQRETDAGQNNPVIIALASYVQKAWTEAKSERVAVEERMYDCMRQRRGEYSAQKLEAIRSMGGSELYMMLTSVKCRAAASWLRDSLLGANDAKPWTLDPTPIPELPPEAVAIIQQRVVQEAQSFLSMAGYQPTPQMIQNAQEVVQNKMKSEQQTEAKKRCSHMETKMEDQLVEGKFPRAMDEFIEDLVTFPAAFLKGPVIRRRPRLTWGEDGQPKVEEELRKEWERVNPLYIYPSPNADDVDDGYLIERHKLSRSDLAGMIGVEGYDESAIRTVLERHGTGGLTEWLTLDFMARSDEEVHNSGSITTSAVTMDALQFWGDVPARMLIEWGMPEDSFEDRDIDYSCECWMIGEYVIKAVLNPDPLRRRPYFKASYEEVPGNFWGHGVADLVRDTQDICNAAARSLVNNMGMASGPQVWVNVDRLAVGETIENLSPWRIHQLKSDPMGGNGAPMGFFQPESLSAELMGVYDKFSRLADEYSGVPKYMTGTEGTPGAGRTASGLSMMINNAGKAIKQVLTNVDVNVLTPAISFLYYHNMRYADDPELKGDVLIRARGASGVVAREAAQVRINEFLNMVIQNQTVTQLVGPEGIAALLREALKVLDMDTTKIIPSEEVVRAQSLAQQNAQQQQQMQEQQLMAQMQEMPTEQINFQRDGEGAVTGAQIMPGPGGAPGGNGQKLMDGGPVTDMFQPAGGMG